MKRILFFIIAVFSLSAITYSQPRPVDKAPTPIANAPASFEARYEGGLFGASDRENGLLKFDDVNERVVFYRKDQKEMFAIPYEALVVIYPDSKVGVSKTGNVVSRLPIPGAGLAGLMSSRTKYLIIQFDDADIDAKGTANFKFEEKDMLISFISTLGTKAKMTQRGDAYYRKRKPVF